MRKLPPGTQIMLPRPAVSATRSAFAPQPQQTAVRSATAVSAVACAVAVCADIGLRSRSGFRHKVERRARRNELFLLGAVLECLYDPLRVLHHPPAHISLVHGLALFRVFLQVSNAGKAQRQFRVMEMLLALEVDLEVLPFDGVQ